jgi:ribosome-associated heat shock protein Hsp15
MGTRIDKFAWSVRLAKTRSIASEQVKKGKIKLNNESVKPSKEVKKGDVVQVIKHTATFEFKIIELLNNRVGAKLVENYITDITTPEEKEKFDLYRVSQQSYRAHGTGKPSKKERRAIEDFLDWTEEEG